LFLGLLKESLKEMVYCFSEGA